MVGSIVLFVVGWALIASSLLICVRSARSGALNPPSEWSRFMATEAAALAIVTALVVGAALVMQQILSWI